MKIKFEVDCLHYPVGGFNNKFEIEVEEWEIDGMNEEEKQEYMYQQCRQYVIDNLDVSVEEIEE